MKKKTGGSKSCGTVPLINSFLLLDKPEVVPEAGVVYGGVGRGASLVCRVYSAPEAEVKWYRGTMLIEPDNVRSGNAALTRKEKTFQICF